MNTKQPTVEMDNPTAVVVDTNAFHTGRLTLGAITSLNSLTNLGLHVIVPDVVCRELASHAWQDFQQSRDLFELADVDTSGVNQAEKIYNTFVSKVQATGATVGESSFDQYRAGLHAQVLRTAPASPKGEVTTGAVDYIVFLHADEAARRFTTVAVITSDKVLRSSLAGRPGIQVFADFGSVRKGGASRMRLPLIDAVAPLKHLLSKAFATDIGEELLPEDASAVKVIGVGDILRLNDNDIIAYVDVTVPYFRSSGENYYGNMLERWQVTLGGTEFALQACSRINQDPMDLWTPDITPLAEYLSTELSMIPSVLRPVPKDKYINATKTPITYLDDSTSSVGFFMGDTYLGSVQHSSYSVTQEYEHDGVVYTDKKEHTSIFLVDEGVKSSRLSKGALARMLTSKALDLVPGPPGSQADEAPATAVPLKA